jgi:hypothetical protein
MASGDEVDLSVAGHDFLGLALPAGEVVRVGFVCGEKHQVVPEAPVKVAQGYRHRPRFEVGVAEDLARAATTNHHVKPLADSALPSAWTG